MGAYSVERARLDRNLKRIPHRIHVNGSRGKSSVVRLIAAGLRGGGMKVVAKTTGTSPRIIHVNGTETPLYRLGKANIREQFHVVDLAAQQDPDALVIECMALQPLLQSIAEHKMVRSTIGVITNCREDHLDVMGPSPTDVAKALCGTIPKGQPLVTAEERFLDIVQSAADTMGSKLHAIGKADIEKINDEEMTDFGYYEHRENVAVALQVTELCGVSRSDAIAGMKNVQPDDGALRVFHVPFFGRDITFVHGFAANDHESSEQIWNLTSSCFPGYSNRVVVLNLRSDRPDRSKRLGASIPTWRPHVDHVVLTGTGIPIAARELMRGGFPPGSVTFAEDHTAREVFEEILNAIDSKSLVVGIGNVADPGLALVTLFRNRGSAVPMSRFYPGSSADG